MTAWLSQFCQQKVCWPAKLTNDAPPNTISHCTHISRREYLSIINNGWTGINILACTLPHTYTYTHIHICIHTYAHTYAHTYIHMHRSWSLFITLLILWICFEVWNPPTTGRASNSQFKYTFISYPLSKKLKIIKKNYVSDMSGPVGRQLTLYRSTNFIPYNYNVSVISI